MLRRLRAAVKEYGWRDAFALAVHHFLARATAGRLRLVRYYFVAQPVPPSALLREGRGARIEVRELPEEAPAVAAMPRPADVVRSRYRQGAHCLGAFLDGELIGFIWFKLGAYQEDEVRALFRPLPEGRTAWDFDVYVEPRHRLGFALARLWDAANARLRASGVAWSVSRISAFNRPSLATHARLGAVRLGSATFLCGRSWQLMISTKAPYWHFSRDPSKFPIIGVEVADGRASGPAQGSRAA